jgi:toxin ParE1/3/4
VLQLRISPRATRDLIEIWNYIADNSITHADSFIDKLYTAIKNLSHHPDSGRLRKELAPGIRSFPFGSYVIFYRSIPHVLEIVRVLHGGRDLETIFEEKDSSEPSNS